MDEAPTEEMKAEETKPEDKAPEAAPAPAETPPAPPAVESPAAPPRPPRKENWLLIALIAVSIIAVLLLVSTICLAVFNEGGCRRGERFEMMEQRMQRGPMMNRDGGGRRGSPWLQEDQNGRVLPPQTIPTPPPQSQPTPPSG